MTLVQALLSAQASGVARLDAQLLLLHALGKPAHDRAWLLAHDTDELALPEWERFEQGVQRRAAGEPLAYITGSREFFGLALQVDGRVLDPRPDTETLVEWALAVMAPMQAPRVIDLGTGSGAIALALKHQRADARVSALDASADALAVARANAQQLGLAIEFSQGSWLSGVSGYFHVIASNPPYIAAADPHLAALSHEPLQALASGADGLEAIRQIIAQAPDHLLASGWLLLEHGWDQAPTVRALLSASGFGAVQSRCDLAGIERCSGGQWAGASGGPVLA